LLKQRPEAVGVAAGCVQIFSSWLETNWTRQCAIPAVRGRVAQTQNLSQGSL